MMAVMIMSMRYVDLMTLTFLTYNKRTDIVYRLTRSWFATCSAAAG